jgi:outer membrane protein assembly factor BamB
MKWTLTVWIMALSIGSATLAADWPGWRGPGRDGISRETGLLKKWPPEGPPLHWQATDIGAGYSSPVIVRGRVYFQTTRAKNEFAVALDEVSGDQVWSVRIGTVGPNRGPQYTGTRSTPSVDGDRIYCLASGGELVCLEAADGRQIWQHHLEEDFGGKPGKWAYAESVLIDGDVLVCTPGGSQATLAALDKMSGALLWESQVPGGENAEYASVMIAGSGAQRQYVQFLRKGLVGVAAKTGKFLWRYDKTTDEYANILTPIVRGNHVFSAGSGTGGGVVELTGDGERMTAKEVYTERYLSASIGGAVLVDGNLYGASKRAMFCADFATGKISWSERAMRNASICCADGLLYVRLHNNGEVALVEPSSREYLERGRLQPPQRSRSKAWPHPVIANGSLYLRDENLLYCYDVSDSQ